MQRSTAGLTLGTNAHRALIDHVRSALPNEAVGLLAGRGSAVEVVLPLPNIATGERTFLADPFAQFSALRQIERDGMELLAIYHSHPGGGTEPSSEDLEYARAWRCAHVIVAIGRDGSVPARLRAYCASPPAAPPGSTG